MDPYNRQQARREFLRPARSALLAAMVVCLPLAGCSTDAPTAPSPATLTGSATAGGSGVEVEQKAIVELARLMALALSDEGLRQRLRNDLRASRHAERKLPAQEYLRGASGGILLAKMAHRSGLARDSIAQLLSAVRPLELYLPVRDHRASWSADRALLVAAALTEEAPPRAFDAAGDAVALQLDAAPSTPTLVLTTRESDLSTEIQAIAAGDMQPRNELPDCYCPTDTTSPTPPSYPSGRYMTYSNLYDLKEPWFRGDPEIEVHVHGPQDKNYPEYGADLACAGASVNWPRGFDQNGHQWSGRVLLFTSTQAAEYAASFSDGYNLVIWEDDDTQCAIRLDNTTFRAALAGIRDLFGVIALLPSRDPYKIGGAFLAALYANASWLLTDDDYLGAVVPAEVAPWLAYSNSHVVFLDANTSNGQVTLVDY